MGCTGSSAVDASNPKKEDGKGAAEGATADPKSGAATTDLTATVALDENNNEVETKALTPEPVKIDEEEVKVTDATSGKEFSLASLFPTKSLDDKRYVDFPTEEPGLSEEHAKGIYGPSPFLPTAELQPGIKYTGQYHGPMMKGFGHLDAGKVTYTGHFDANKYNGLGRTVMADGSICEGQFKDGKANGYCVYSWPNGDVHLGMWVDNKRHGWGKMIMECGDVVYSQFNNGGRTGFGRAYFADGGTYAGEFSGMDIDGFGIHTWPDGRMYKGTWKLSQQEGDNCRMEWPDGRIYVGQFFQGKMAGKGVMTWPDGRKYDGEWRDSFQHGTGNYYDSAGSYRKAQYIDGVRVKYLGTEVAVEREEPLPEIEMPTGLAGMDLGGEVRQNVLDDFIINKAKSDGGLSELLGQRSIEAY